MKYVMDASALLAMTQFEVGGKLVEDLIASGSCMASSVNIAEVGSKLLDQGLNEAELAQALSELDVEVIDFDLELATQCAKLRKLTRHAGLSLGDRACLALAEQKQATAVTSDRAWSAVEEAVGVKVLQIR